MRNTQFIKNQGIKLFFALSIFFISYSSNAQIAPVNDCADLTSPVCGSGTFGYTFGSGDDVDFTLGSVSNPSSNPAGFNSGCLLAGELNPMFMLINVTSSGTLEWNFGNISGSSACQDWIMWPYTATTCGQIAAGTLPPVACNWNGACSGLTGMASPVPPGGNPADFQNELNVTAGQQFLLCISNYSGQSGTAAMNFTGTATVGCGGNVSICPGGSVLLNATQPGALSYSWSPPTGLSSTNTATTTATPAASTLYTCTITYATGTQDTMINVTIHTPPTTGFTTTPETCAGDNDGTITMTPTGTAPFTYTLNGVPTAGPTFTGIGGGNYTVVITDGNGCSSTVVIPFAAGPVCCTMVLNTTSTLATCPYNCDGTANVNIVGNVNPPIITWQNAAGVPIGQSTATAAGLCPGNYIAEVNDPGECTLTMNVTVNAAPGLTITSVTPTNVTCNGACDGEIAVNAPSAIQYSIDGGVSFQASNLFTGLCAMTYSVIAENANGCQDTVPCTITQPAVLTVQVANGGAINPTCFGVSNGAINMNVTGGTLPYSYLWNTTPAQTVEDALNVPDGTWCLNVTDALGCTSVSNCVTITQPSDLTLNFLVVNPTCFNYCDGNASVVPSGGTAPYTYNWNGIAGTTPTSTQATGLCDGTYDLVVTDANGCTEDSLNFPVVHPAQVQVGLVTPTDESCFQTCDGQISIASPDGAMYSINAGATFQASPLFTALCSGTYDVVVEDVNGCSNTTTTTLNAQPEIIADFFATPQPTDIYSTEITFHNTSVFASTYAWTFDTLGASTDTEPTFFFPDTGPGVYEVCLTGTDVNGCFDTVCHNVVINDILYYYVPNAFTPDGNGTNDIFLPVLNNVATENYNFYVFNRWGETVFHTTDITEGWDGMSKNIKAKSDVYVWKITGKNNANAEKFQVVGHVSLLR